MGRFGGGGGRGGNPPYQLLFSARPALSKAPRSVLVLFREGAVEQQSLRRHTHTPFEGLKKQPY